MISPIFEWIWNNTYKNLYDRAKNIMKKNAVMVFYNEKEQLYLETDVLGVGLGASILHVTDEMQFPKNEAPDNAVMWPIACMIKNLKSTETHYNNIGREP